jgi:hypothetical protein
MNDCTMQPLDEVGQFLRAQTPAVLLPKASEVVGLRPSGGYGPHHGEAAHGELADSNAPDTSTAFTHINRGRPDQSVLYLGHDSLSDVPIQMPDAIPKWLLRKYIETADVRRINPVSLAPEEFTRQHGPHPGHVVTWHDKRVPPPERPPLTLWERLLPWTRPRLTAAEKWALKQLD